MGATWCVTWQSRNSFLTSFASVLWTVDTCSTAQLFNSKAPRLWSFYPDYQVSLFAFCILLYIAFSLNMCIFLVVGTLCIFLHNTSNFYYVYKRLNVLVCTNWFSLSFLTLCSVLVYHGYVNANVGLWFEGTRLNIFSITHHRNKYLKWTTKSFFIIFLLYIMYIVNFYVNSLSVYYLSERNLEI